VKSDVSQALFDSEADELSYVANRCRALLESSPQKRIGVVVPDLDERRSSVLRAMDGAFFPAEDPMGIESQGRPYDVSLGVPLVELPPIRAAINSLGLVLRTLDSAELSQWLLSPYLVDANQNAGRRARLDHEVRSQALQRLDAQRLIESKKIDSSLQKSLRSALKTKLGTRRTITAFADYFARLLDSLGWPGEALGSDEYQAVEAWRGVLDDLQHLDDGSPLSTDEALNWLHRVSRDRVFQPESRDVPIQVMGRLESHGLCFDELMVIGLDSSNWPPGSDATTFLPFAEQREAGVPESAKELQLDIAKKELSAWLSAAACVFIGSVKLRNGQEMTRTELLSSIPERAPDGRYHRVASPAALIQAASKEAMLYIADTHGPVIHDDDKALGGARLFEDQAQCPFRAFALHRLRIRPLEESTLGLDPRAHGNLLHHALEYFWAELNSHAALVALSDDELKDLLTASIDRSLEDNRVSQALQAIERVRLLALLLEWLKLRESGRSGFTVEAMEKEQLVSYQGFSFALKVDRIDRLDSGERIILDYKTGTNNNPRGWAARRIENPQLPLYALVSGNVDGVAYAQVAKNACQFKGIAADAALLDGVVSKLKFEDLEISDWQGWLDHWRDSLDTIAIELRTGLASVTPTKNACQFCELPALCRIAELDDNGLGIGSVQDHSANAGGSGE
jgi:probable DNA repair protein